MPGEWPQTKAILTEAVKLDKGDRRQFIAAACANRPELRDELLSILESYDTASRVCDPARVITTRKTIEPVLAPDTTYGPYRVLKQLGAGGMGQVFLALDERLNRRVAMKSLAGRWLESPTARQRLMREARSAAALTHPHIATLYDVLEVGGHLLLVMEYVEGRSASARLEEGPIPIGHALRLAIQMADAVSYAHDRGIIHCDIKPANVQIAVDGTAKVLDFGLARARYDVGDAEEVNVSEQGKLVGTLGYMAPERLIEGTLNASGDIYSLGVVTFEMVTGQRFFDGRDLSAFLLTVLGSHVPKPSAAVSWVPTALDEVVERALAKKPTQRYQSARELSRDLQNVLALVEGSGSGVLTDPPGSTVQQSTRARLYQRGLAVTAGLGAAFVTATLAGFVTSTMFNSAFGIAGDFQTESAFMWPIWGIRSLIAPMFYVGAAMTVLAVLLGLSRLCWKFEPFQRRCRGLMASTHSVARWVKSLPTPVLAQLLLIVHCAVIALNFWYFSDFMQAFDALIVHTTGGSLAPLSPASRDQHNLYRQVLSLEFGAFAAAWYAVLKKRLERHERGLDVGIAGGIALVAFTLFLLSLPFRVLYHNEHERVLYGTDTCYFIEKRGSEGLLFCPMREPPRNQVVSLDDAQLVRGGAEEDMFSRVNR